MAARVAPTAYEPAPDAPQFGDIFRGVYLFDAYLQDDARAMGHRAPPSSFGTGAAYSPLFPAAAQTDFVLAHGIACDAVLLTDDCALRTMLGLQAPATNAAGEPITRRVSGRFLFAAISPSTAATETFGRFSLPVDTLYPGGTVELRRVFMFDARKLDLSRNGRQCTLSRDLARDLATRWSAYATRRGPIVSAKNCSVLAEWLGRLRASTHDADARAVAQVLASAWDAEGELDAFDDRVKTGVTSKQAIGELATRLETVARGARAAALRLRSY